MKAKIVGMLVCMLLIATMIIPVTGKTNVPTFNENIINLLQTKNSADSKLKFMIGGSALRCFRAYRMYIPDSYDGSQSVPLVLAFHGGTLMGTTFRPISILRFYRDTFLENYTDLNEKADEEGFIVVYPKGLAFFVTFYNLYVFSYLALQYPDSGLRFKNLIDDIGFIEDLIDKMQRDYNIDSDKIYVCGLSAGGDMTHSIGCVLSDKVAAISVVAGSVACKAPDDEDYIYPPIPENPVPIIIFHGTNDTVIPWEGNEENCAVNDSVQFWVENNNCDTVPDINVSESGKIIRYTYSNGTDESEVILYKSIGGSHCWPGNDFTDPNNTAPWLVDTIQEIDATDLMWEFFEQYPK